MKVVLMSGGCDCMAVAEKVGCDIALFFDYGQRGAKYERKAAKWYAKQKGAKFVEMDIKVLYKHSKSILINKDGDTEEVENRNLLFCTLACTMFPLADVYIGIHKSTIHDLPDCTPAFIDTLHSLYLNVHAPFINDTKDVLLKYVTREMINNSYTCYLGKKKGSRCDCTACSTMRKFTS